LISEESVDSFIVAALSALSLMLYFLWGKGCTTGFCGLLVEGEVEVAESF
jgi:hypothetical protein